MLLPLSWPRVLGILALLLCTVSARAQQEFNTWYFGQFAGLRFQGTTVQALTDGAMLSGEGCATISDAQGQLLFYTNGITAWNRLHQPLSNGTALGGFADAARSEIFPNSATQGVTIVPKPGSRTEYYVFTVDAAENNLRGGLHYSVVDIARQGGLGEVVQKAVPVPIPVGDGRLTEKLVAVRHANQHDIWLVVHGWNSNVFLSFLLTDSGLSSTPVISAGGTVHQGGTNPRQDYNALGYMKVAPTGRRLAVAQYDGPLEVFDFNYGTGVVSGPRRLPTVPLPFSQHYYGLEFSPDGNLLYVSPALYQYNLLTGAMTAIGQLATPPRPFAEPAALQLGPDQKIYVALTSAFSNPYGVGVIAAPNTLGVGCQYQFNAVPGFSYAHNSRMGLPNVLVRPPVPGELLATFGLVRTEVCLGETVAFAASLYPQVPDAVVTWDFGEPAAGAANTATGRAVPHRYATSGTYTVTMTVREVSGATHTYQQRVTILPFTEAHLTVDQPVLCSGTPARLRVTPAQPAGTTYRWQDGSTGAEYATQTSGRYWVEVTAPQRCPVRDSVALTFLPVPALSLEREQTICAEQHLMLDPGPQPAGSRYRWQDGSTQASLEVVTPGDYTVQVTSPAGCSSRVQVQVRFGEACPFTIPNIITPNGDQLNETLVLKGLEPGAWQVQVFNRWGRQVYEQAYYQGQWDAAGQPDGIYYYWLLHPVSGRRYRGWVEVKR
ncbi:T9SS type B sorting domain-containing protein [Hymenobacter crusticola]|uniref:PKD domain-containing protein n=1 Tax=Hymenobacter crusticola TaxID=1770526 RepID=A0A243W7D0_9BACT|nr:gliding motility-associated C-terminal domain-containing protein [Hymenobacter crusticola]OUJ67712.1 hypothetical protein BXP70_28680 [Hymenobacter crusticola]